ncbi:MAG TPA: hypothetical protein PKA38_04965 [Candidatus Levybacteria bacterium]|nr:hypothetical protein [Candidatus Levybacteria bacterium]
MKKNIVGIIVLGLIVLGAIIYGFNSSGSPAAVRAAKFDLERQNDFSDIRYGVNSYFDRYGKLPKTLVEVNQYNSYAFSREQITDPETKKEYEYIPMWDNTYQLCAVFSTSTEVKSDSEKLSAQGKTAYRSNADFSHPAGRFCFSFKTPTVAPQIEEKPSPVL